MTAGEHRRRKLLAGAISRAAAVLAMCLFVMCLFFNAAAFAAEPRVILLRGWFGVFSTGLDSIADALKANGITAQVTGHQAWKAAIADILREQSSGKPAPIVLIGHSQGANNVIEMARELATHNVQVDLLITLVPYLQEPVPANVLHAVNFYQSGGWGAPLTTDPGFKGKLDNVNLADDPSILHISIDKSARVQNDIVREILALSQPPAQTPAARAAPARPAAQH